MHYISTCINDHCSYITGLEGQRSEIGSKLGSFGLGIKSLPDWGFDGIEMAKK